MKTNTLWYKEFWPWFLIALPSTVVIACLITVILCNMNPISLVAEDHYKKGKGINQDLSRLKEAQALSISASLSISDKMAVISLNKGDLMHYPSLFITFQHRTLPNKDIEQWVTADAEGRYRVTIDADLIGPWYIKIMPFDKVWALQGRNHFPSSAPVLFNTPSSPPLASFS